MPRGITVACAAALLSLASSAGSARPFTAKDLAMLDRVSNPRLAPDGNWIAVNLRTTDWEGNKGVNALRLMPRTPGGTPVVVTASEKAPTSPRWARDGRLYFLSGKSGTQQVWRRDADRRLTQITAFPLDITGFRLAPDGRSLVAIVDARPECATFACSKEADETKAKLKPTGQFFGDGVRARAWDAYEDGRYTGLYRVALGGDGAPSEAVRLTGAWRGDVIDRVDGGDGDVAISGDGRSIYFAARDPALIERDDAPSALWVVPADGSSGPRRMRPGDALWVARPTLSPDGRTLAYLARRETASYSRTALMALDLKSGQAREIAPGGDRQLRRIAWSRDGRTIYATGEATGQGPLMSIDAARGTERVLVAQGNVGDFDVGAGSLAYVAESLGGPGQLYLRAGAGGPVALTEIGKQVFADAPLAPAEQFSFPGWNGETVHGYIVKPQNFVAGRKYPVAFLIHGGPHGSFGNSWSYRWNPQVWASMGYAAVMIDFHGSSGYGEDFGRSILNHWGDRPLEDLRKGWAHALGRYDWLDGSRACALGGSYGGYMVNWIAGQWPGAWKCLVNHAGLFDSRVMAYSTDTQAFAEAQYRGLSALATATEGRFDPSDAAARWKVPMLVIHGARDYRVPLDQGIAAHNAARRAGVPTEMLLFPDENHWVLKPQNSVQWYATVEAWMARWLGARADPAASPPMPSTR
jgi:acylaminoacyl-peptidase